MFSKSSSSYLFLLIVLALAVGSGILYQRQAYNYGLDVRGGVRLVYRMEFSKLSAEQAQNKQMVRDQVARIMTQRVGASLGVVEGNVQQKGADELIVELPGFKDVSQARATLGTSAKLRAYHARNVVTERSQFRQYVQAGEEKIGDATVVTFRRRSGDEKVLLPSDPEYQRMIAGWDVILEGNDLATAFPEVQGNRTVPTFRFSADGSRKISDWSRRVMNRRELLAFVLDGKVLSIAPIQDNTILRDSAFIDGDFDPQYVKQLTQLLNAGALPVDLTEISSQTVDPTIGQKALEQMVFAGIISFAFVSFFLLVYYVFPGFVALIALCLYVLFTLAVLKAIGATFSLAAIAGFILSVGIAVDANILVFERFKEEMREGKPLMRAIDLGFKRAFPSILDSNACTVLTSIVLANLGTGPVKGFATTLIIGVVISLFTAVTVTRSLLIFLVGSGIGANPKFYGLERQWFGESLEATADSKPLQIVNTSKKWFLISGITIVVGLPFAFIGGLKPNVEFLGGFEAVYGVPASGGLTSAQIGANLERAGFKGSNVKFATADDQRLVYVTVPASQGLTAARAEQAKERISQASGLPQTELRGFSSVGPSVQQETWRNAILGVLISTALIVLYLTIRFGVSLGGARNGIKFGLSAVGALVHDVLVVVGVAAIVGYFLGWEVSALFITAMLTVIGFSVHDTVVVFDRIRENLRKPHQNEDFANLANRSVTQSFGRSINTSLTVIVSLAILIAFGTATPDLKFFCLAMLVGILSGTYSSIYNAAPILYLWDKAVMRRRGEEHGLIQEAERARLARIAMERELGLAQGAVTPEARTESYSQVRRRSSVVEKSKTAIDDDDK